MGVDASNRFDTLLSDVNGHVGGEVGEQERWSGSAVSPSAHHWIEVQPWESVHQSIARRGAALASAAAGHTITTDEILIATEGVLLPGRWAPSTTTLYSTMLHGKGFSAQPELFLTLTGRRHPNKRQRIPHQVLCN